MHRYTFSALIARILVGKEFSARKLVEIGEKLSRKLLLEDVVKVVCTLYNYLR